MGAGVTSRRALDQRAAHPDRAQGQVEREYAGQGQAVRAVLLEPDSCQAAEPALSAVRSVPGDRPAGSRFGSAHRAQEPESELHGTDARGRVAAEPLDRADGAGRAGKPSRRAGR